ncbi:insulinase family protein, partial [bacterium]|nr:insulinase family protein [bacterium]
GDQISEAFDSMGAVYGCNANHTRIQSSLTLLSQDFEEGFGIFADILMNPKLDPGQIEKQRGLIKAGILARKDDWATEAIDRMVNAYFGDHPYASPPVGTEESVDLITRDDLLSHYAAYISPDNTVITVFGNVVAEDALATVEKAFDKWKPSNVALPSRVRFAARTEPETVTTYHTRAQAVIAMGFPGMPYQSGDRYAMDVLDGIISGIYYPGGWLHADLRGKGLVYVVHAYNWTGLDEGYFGIYAATVDEAIEEAVGIIDGYIEQIKADYVTDEELGLAKQLCITMDQTQSQTNASQANDAAIAELYGLGYDFTDDYTERIAEVTKEDVMRVARKYLNNPVTILRRPEPEPETELGLEEKPEEDQ